MTPRAIQKSALTSEHGATRIRFSFISPFRFISPVNDGGSCLTPRNAQSLADRATKATPKKAHDIARQKPQDKGYALFAMSKNNSRTGETTRAKKPNVTERINQMTFFQQLCSLIALIFGIPTGAYFWIRSTAQHAVLEERFLATLAAKVRPTCIFTTRGAIESNSEATDYIEDIQVTPVPEIYGFKVLLKAKRHFTFPLVSPVDINLYPESTERTHGNDWLIVLRHRSLNTVLDSETAMDTNAVYRFKIEILH
jgi:hypothetical protein